MTSDARRFEPVRDLLQRRVDDGRFPGFVAAVRHRGSTEVLVGGLRQVAGDLPMTADTGGRISSLSKPFAGVLTLSLVEDGFLGLDDTVHRWLPELEDRHVLCTPTAPLDDTTPAHEPITVRHLLTNTAGFGGIPESCPLGDAMQEQGLDPSGFPPEIPPDEYLRRLGALPLAAQPGERWLYHTSSDVLSVLLARAAGRPLSDLLAERITGPLDLQGTGFTADPARLGTQYDADGRSVLDLPDGLFARPPVFEGLAAGLVSTAPDLLTFLTALADGGEPLLSQASARAMTADALTPEQRAPSQDFMGPGMSWGLQVGVVAEPPAPWSSAGRWGWDGGTGTSGWVDPSRDLAGVLLTQKLMGGPDDAPDYFWKGVHDCLER